jgi:phage terminase large subunit-like protein
LSVRSSISQLGVDELEALAVKAELELARRDLGEFGRLVYGYQCLPHIRQWCDAVQDDSIEQLIIISPPGSAKSTWMGTVLPSWYLGRNPDGHILLLSHSASHASKFSTAARDTIASSPIYHQIFPHIKPDAAKGWAQDRWYIERRNVGDPHPTMMASGFDGPILGSRASLLILDDVMDEACAASAEQRAKLKELIKGTVFSRRVRGCKSIIILTRWNADDLAAEFVDSKGVAAPGWTVIHMPAIGYWGPDTPLAPEIASLDELLAIKNDVRGGIIRFENIWQGNPTVQQGTILQRAWWRRMPLAQMPRKEDCQVLLQCWDTAFKKTADSAFSVCITAGLYKGSIFFYNMYRKKIEFPELLKVSRQLFKLDRPRLVLVEDKASGQCYSDDTEVLTRRGWKLFEEVDTTTDEFATRNPQTKEFEWQYAYARTDEPHAGNMYHFCGRSIDILVTPEHRMLIDRLPRKLGGNALRKGEVVVAAKDLAFAWNASLDIPVTSIWRGKRIVSKSFPMDKQKQAQRFAGRVDTLGRRVATSEPAPVQMSGDDYCAFMGMYLSEGWWRIQESSRSGAVFICQYPTSPYLQEFSDALDSIFGHKVPYSSRKHQFTISRRGLAEHIAKFGHHAWEKFVPDDIMNATPKQLRIFWKFYSMGDGCTASGMEQITTSSEHMAGQLVEIAQKIGQHASMAKKIAKKDILIGSNKHPTLAVNRRPTYVVSLRKSKTMGFHVEQLPYSGMAHCISVPNGIIYVRRHGKPAWCGQSLIQSIQAGTGIEDSADKQSLTLPMLPIKADSDPVSYVNAFSGYLEAGRCWLPVEGLWQDDLLNECAAFPQGQYKDVPMVWAHIMKYMTSGDQFSRLSEGAIVSMPPMAGEPNLGDWSDLPGPSSIAEFLNEWKDL